MHTCARMCEKNLKNILLSVHVYMQIGAYITQFVCMCDYIYIYICVEVFMLIHVIFNNNSNNNGYF